MQTIQEAAIQDANSTTQELEGSRCNSDDSDADSAEAFDPRDFEEEEEEFQPTKPFKPSRTILKEQMKFREWPKADFEKAIKQMDEDQKRVFDLIEDHCNKITDKEHYPIGPPAIHIFCSGSAGYYLYYC